MGYKNKVHLTVRNDANGWFNFSKGTRRIQLCGDSRKDGYFLKQYADKLGKEDFMKDFTEILAEMAKDGAAAFTLYELPEIINGRIK